MSYGIYCTSYDSWIIEAKDVKLIANKLTSPDFLMSWNQTYFEAALIAAEKGKTREELMHQIKHVIFLDGMQKMELGKSIYRSWGVKI
jgi:hypothetical protein